jgi:uncharacterized protein
VYDRTTQETPVPQFNVATLLREPVGATRRATFDAEPLAVPEAGYATSASGPVELVRTARGVLVRARLRVRPRVECVRCLAPCDLEITIDIAEEFVPLRDPLTGEPVSADPDEFRIDARHHLDLSEAVRQYEQAALPLGPLCRPDCAGLCPSCGQNLNEQRCGCPPPEPAAAWQGLAALAERLRSEESVGGPEA